MPNSDDSLDTNPPASPTDRVPFPSKDDIDQHSDLILNICLCILGDHEQARIQHQAVLKTLRSQRKSNRYKVYLRPWILHTLFEKLKNNSKRPQPSDSTYERAEVTQNHSVEERMKRIHVFLKGLPYETHFSLLLMERFQIPIEEISHAIKIPVESIQLRVEQALNILYEWIWESDPSQESSSDLEGLFEILRNSIQSQSPNVSGEENSLQEEESISTETKSSSHWRRQPWFVRTSVEGFGVAAILIFVVAIVPQIQSLFNQSTERKFDISVEDIEDAADIEIDLPGVSLDQSSPDITKGEDSDYSTNSDSPQSERPKIRVGAREIWRFNIHSESPEEVRPLIAAALSKLKYQLKEKEKNGVTVPGGIQFTFFLPSKMIPELMEKVEKIALSIDQVRTPGIRTKKTFTWFKSRSRKRVPRGKTHVFIWLSQL